MGSIAVAQVESYIHLRYHSQNRFKEENYAETAGEYLSLSIFTCVYKLVNNIFFWAKELNMLHGART